ncbi:molybdate ABC transporter permease subunit [Geovibrio ferrireducens]|uniref:molybdate ABC transporter permease subunit n=1 Tax=Geovibrio ferrireducens TaxID=46201 RepID=UPI0022463D04|nr:ABC transporter permease subunit [Geovibrio ferrireducens]
MIDILNDENIVFSILLTARTCLAVLVLHCAAGLMLGYYLGKRKGIFAGFVDFLVTLPLVFPPVGTGFILLYLLGRNGLIASLTGGAVTPDIIFTEKGVITAAFIAGLPLVVKPVQSAIEREVLKLAEAARTLGKTEFQTFFLVVVPSVRRSLGAGLILAAGRSLGEVGITLMVGGNIIGKTNTVSLEIYNSVMDADFTGAAFLCILLGSISLAVFFSLKKLSAL